MSAPSVLRFSAFSVAIYLGMSVLFSAGCADDPSPHAHAPRRALPPYTGTAPDLFDDGLDPAAVGLELEVRGDPMSDPKLRQRVQTADATLRVRVQTVTEKREDEGTTYVLGLKTLDVFGGEAPDGEFSVHVGRESPSHGIVGSFESRLVGKTFIAVVKQFTAGGDGDGDVHFHFTADDAKTVAAVKAALALEGFRTSPTDPKPPAATP
jgi:hypothetical protein